MNTRAHFEKVYDRYSDMLYRLALSYLNNREDAQDVVHEVFIRYIENDGLRDDEHERAWLVRVTINASHDLLRKNKHRLHEDIDDCKDLTAKEMESNVYDILAELPEKFKSVVVLHYLEGYSVEEIARMLHIGVSAVKMRLKRARGKIADAGKENFDV